MDLQLFIALNAVMISAMAIAAAVIYRPQDRADWFAANAPWLAVNAAVVAAGALALWLAPEWAAIVVLALFVPFVAAPIVLYNLSQRRAHAGATASPARLAYAAALLHPTTANWMNAHLLSAVAKSNDGNTAPLDALAMSAPPQYRPVVQAFQALARRDWGEILALSALDDGVTTVMKALEIRALGETGQTDAMVRSFRGARMKLTGGSANIPKLVVLAFGGRPEAVARQLADKLTAMEAEMRAYWLAVAQLNSATQSTTGQRTLAQLAAGATRQSTQRAAQLRLAAFAAPSSAPSLRPATASGLDAIVADMMDDGAAPPARVRAAFPVTVALIALNAIAFAAELITGDAEDTATLVHLGALWPPDVLEHGQWWRLLSAAFLHFGAIHIISNMFVLFVLGRLLEPMIGSARLAVIYLLGAVASSAFVLWLMWAGYSDYGLLVGASGAIFSLFGAEVMIVLQEWRQSPATFDNRRLTMLGVILLMQMALDLSVPNISFSAHASGLIAGVVVMGVMMVAWPVRPLRWAPQPKSVPASRPVSPENPASGPQA